MKTANKLVLFLMTMASQAIGSVKTKLADHTSGCSRSTEDDCPPPPEEIRSVRN